METPMNIGSRRRRARLPCCAMRERETYYRYLSMGRSDGSEVGHSLDQYLRYTIDYAYTATYTETP